MGPINGLTKQVKGDSMPIINNAHDSDIVIARNCSICGGMPQQIPDGCFRCNNTGREVFLLSDCWWIDKRSATSIELTTFNTRHGATDQYGGPRVRHRKI